MNPEQLVQNQRKILLVLRSQPKIEDFNKCGTDIDKIFALNKKEYESELINMFTVDDRRVEFLWVGVETFREEIKEYLNQHSQDDVIVFCHCEGNDFDGYAGPVAVSTFLEENKIKRIGDTIEFARNADNKILMKRAFINHGVCTSPFIEVSTWTEEEQKALQTLKFPVLVKPSECSCSMGLKLNNRCESFEEVDKVVKQMLADGFKIYIEEFITGRELTIPVICNGIDEEIVLPLVEITFNESMKDSEKWLHFNFYWSDLGEKNINKRAILDGVDFEGCKEQAVQAFRSIKGIGPARVDIRKSEDGKYYVLEVNDAPGMRKVSNFMRSLRASGKEENFWVRELLKYPRF